MKIWSEETTGEIWNVVNAWEAARVALEKYNAVYKVPSIHTTLHNKEMSATYSGYKYNYPTYASGTSSVPRSTLALVDEIGEELILQANKYGRLTHLTKGSSVIPADATEKLMMWAKQTPETFASRLVPVVSSITSDAIAHFSGAQTLAIGDIYITGDTSNITKSDLAKFRKEIVSDVYESMQHNRVKSGKY